MEKVPTTNAKQNLLDFISNLTPEQIDKIMCHLPELKKIISNEAMKG